MLPRPGTQNYLATDVLALEKVQRRASRLALGQKRGEMEYKDRLRKLKWPTLETGECYKIVFDMNLTLTTFLNLPSAIQPALTIHINYMLSQQSVIHINILFLSESYGTGIVYQDLFMRLGA